MHEQTGAPPTVARIDETACIGCTLCIQACPVDAIVGAVKQMHTVVAAWCTGCELCLPPCPVDCIAMLSAPLSAESRQATDDRILSRTEFHLQRVARERREKADRYAGRDAARRDEMQSVFPHDVPDAADTRRALVAAAVARARQLTAR